MIIVAFWISDLDLNLYAASKESLAFYDFFNLVLLLKPREFYRTDGRGKQIQFSTELAKLEDMNIKSLKNNMT